MSYFFTSFFFIFFSSLTSIVVFSQQIKRISQSDIALVVTDAGAQENLVEAQCVAQRWLADLYQTSPELYKTWIKREQERVAFQDTMTHPRLYECFKAFAEKEFNGENIAFLEAVKGYKTLVGAGDSAARRRDGCAMLKLYVLESGLKQVNLPMKKRKTIEKAFENKCAADSVGDVAVNVFDVAFAEIEALISNDVFSRFKNNGALAACPEWKKAAPDMLNYIIMQQQYCADEKVAFRAGDADRKNRTFKAILKGWAKKCATNPDFFPPELQGRPRAVAV